MIPGERWFSKRELAREIGVSVRTVERLRLPHVPVSGMKRYFLSEVEPFLRGERPDLPSNVVQLPSPRQRSAA